MRKILLCISLIVLLSCPTLNDDLASAAYETLPTITQQPEEWVMVTGVPNPKNPGTSVEFRVTATGVEPLTYQWQKASMLIIPSIWSNIDGANTAVYSFIGYENDCNTYFRVVVSDDNGSVTSDIAPLTLMYVHNPIHPIMINEQPAANTTVTEGNVSGDLFVEAITIYPGDVLNYQWFSSKTNNYEGGTLITSETNNTFKIPTTLKASENPYYYYCLIYEGSQSYSLNSDVAAVSVIKAGDDSDISNDSGGCSNSMVNGGTFGMLAVFLTLLVYGLHGSRKISGR